MKITRWGARANNGQSSIDLDNPEVSLALSGNGVVIKDRDIPDFVTKAHYDYNIKLSFEEVAKFIEVISNSPDEKKMLVATSFEPQLKNIMKLANMIINR